MKFDVGITVLRQYDQLAQCLDAVWASSLLPQRVIVVDNGGEFDQAKQGRPGLIVLQPNGNLGVAASWNLLLRLIHPLPAIILNDDCCVAPDTLERMMAVPGPALVTGHGWACFRHDREVRQRVGDYDEEFWPAYYEDADYHQRMKVCGTDTVDLGNIVASHGNHGERPYQNFNPQELKEFHCRLEANKQRFIRKWGKLPS